MVLPASVLVRQQQGISSQEHSISLETGARFPQHWCVSGQRAEADTPAPLHSTALFSHLPCHLIYFRLICKLSFNVTSVFGVFHSLLTRRVEHRLLC